MCGIFGYATKDGKALSVATLKRIAVITMRRGADAWGMAWIDGKGQIRSYKQTGRIVDGLALLNMARDARFLIGHCRYATHGSPENNANNHPHAADGGWIVHNGIIGNYRQIIDQNDLNPVTDCDSEVLGLLIERIPGRIEDRCWQAADFADPFPLAMLGLWKPGQLVALRQYNQPLHVGETKGGFYLASLAEGLPGRPRMLEHERAYLFAGGRPQGPTNRRRHASRCASAKRPARASQGRLFYEGRRLVEACEPCKAESGVRLIGKTRPRFR